MKTIIPKEHQLKCEGCGKILDMRNASVISHGWIEDGKIICYDVEVPYSSSQKLSEPILWTKDKKAIDLN